jgi:hypothetical protein
MVSKCANPECSATFLYFHTGRLFRIETSSGQERRRAMGEEESSGKPLRRVEFYWLCESCAPRMTLAYEHDTGISVRPNPQAASAAA